MLQIFEPGWLPAVVTDQARDAENLTPTALSTVTWQFK